MDLQMRTDGNKMSDFGALIIKGATIEYEDETALKLLNAPSSLLGRKLTSVLPDYFPLQRNEKSKCQRINIDAGSLLVSSMLFPPDSESIVVLLHDLVRQIVDVRENQIAKQIYRDVNTIIESVHIDMLITDNKGVILYVSPSFKKNYGLSEQEVVGKTVFKLEQQQIFNPALTPLVLESKKKIAKLQRNKAGRRFMVTAIPLFNDDNEIERVVSYARSVEHFLELKNQYKKLEYMLSRYSSEVRQLRDRKMHFPGIVSKSREMKNIVGLADKVATVDANVIITGESGVGKNLVAHMIHKHSARSKGPFIEINCGAIPQSLLESELFGYAPGAFTGAHRKGKIGMIELANEGTLFLDEVGDLPLDMQVKLLKVIQDKSLQKIGGDRKINVDFRLVAATNKDLLSQVEKKRFREDLYYRLHVFPINIPSLRNRTEDILPLVMHFLMQAKKRYNKSVHLTKDSIDILLSYHWPGNVRELENIIERIVITTDKKHIDKADLPRSLKKHLTPADMGEDLTLKSALELLEKQMIQDAYKKYKTTVGVGKALGISQPSAARKIKKHISAPIQY